MALEIFSDIPVITPGVLKDCILFLPVWKSAEIYKKYIKTNKPLPEIESKLGSRLVAGSSLDIVRGMNDESRLKQDIGYIQVAVKNMDKGEWEKALKAMRSIPRKSPYSDMKVFAMGEAIHKQTFQANLEKTVTTGDIKNINQWIKSLSEVLLPDRPQEAVIHLLEIIGFGKSQINMDLNTFKKLLKSNIPSKTLQNQLIAKAISVRQNFLSFYSVQYLENIEKEFPDKTIVKSPDPLCFWRSLKP
ncbi:MAG: hypothetical protein GXP56_19530 [Deltaproteobacteria bacterium]|nr:hypothetical protein [Deltaproteobacteria bacterium]